MGLLLKAALFLPLVVYVLEYLRANYLHNLYIFDHEKLQAISQRVIAENEGANSTALLKKVHVALKEEYGDYINDWDDSEWVFNNAGNAMGSMIVLHTSVTEYLIFFGTAVGTEGHTGTHFADDYFTILYGEQLAAYASSQQPDIYYPGDVHYLPAWRNQQYRMPQDSWALELAQGYIPAMLPFGMIETFTSTFDVYSFGKTVKISAREMFKNLLRGKI